MDKKFVLIVIIAVIVLSLSSFGSRAQTVGNCTNYAYYNTSNAFGNRTWIITNSTLCLGVSITNISNITIRSGGTLYLQQVNISFNGSVDSVNFTVESGGALKIDNGSRIFSANGTNLGINFYYLPGSSGWINNSSISNLNNFTGSNGININTTNFEFSNSTINNSLGYALNISGGSPTIKNSTFYNNSGGILVWNSSPTLLNLSIGLAGDTATDAALNITNSNNASITNVTTKTHPFGIVFTNSNLTLYNISINNFVKGIFTKSTSIITLVDSVLNNASGQESYHIYFNVSSNASNMTLINVQYNNYTFHGNNTANLTEKWYVDLYVRANVSSNNTLVNGATLTINNTTVSLAGAAQTSFMTFTTNTSGTIQRLNLTHFIAYMNSSGADANITVNFSNYLFNATKGNATATNSSVNITNNFINANNITLAIPLVTVTVNANGGGAAAGWSIQNALITFTNGTFSFTVNTSDTGIANATLPYGEYNVSIVHANFSGHRVFVNSTILNASSTNITVNLSLFPRINYTGNYSYFSDLGDANRSTINETDHELNSGMHYRVSGRVYYAHNNSTVNATVYISSNTSDIRTSTYKSITLGSAFVFDKTAPSPSSATNYTDFVIFVNDSHGDNGTRVEWLRVVPVTTNDSGSTTTSGTGGGGGEAGDYALVITEYDRKIAMAQGESKVFKVTVKNTGLKTLSKVSLSLAGVSSTWYKVNISSTGQSTEDLTSGEAVTYDVKISIPSTSTAMTYKGTWRAKDKDSLALAEKTMNLTVTQIWNTANIANLNLSLAELEKLVASLEKNVSSLSPSVANYTQIQDSLKSIKDSMSLARSEYDSGDYSSAKADADSIVADMAALISMVDLARSKGAAAALARALREPVGLGLLIGVIGAAAAGGFFIWWKFFKVLSISDIKRNPAKFAAGVRIEGVVKSITDTKKGKVFLIGDTSGEKLHVRYPYYTTTELDDVIRVNGVIKTYKDVAYMDATELQRLSMKPAKT